MLIELILLTLNFLFDPNGIGTLLFVVSIVPVNVIALVKPYPSNITVTLPDNATNGVTKLEYVPNFKALLVSNPTFILFPVVNDVIVIVTILPLIILVAVGKIKLI